MAYATEAQIVARLPSVAVANAAFDATVAEALEWADSRVDEGLVSRYPVPFATPYPTAIKQLAADFACVFVFRSETESEPSQTAADKLEASCERRMAMLLKNGIPGMDEESEDVPGAEGLAHHSGFGCTSELAELDWLS